MALTHSDQMPAGRSQAHQTQQSSAGGVSLPAVPALLQKEDEQQERLQTEAKPAQFKAFILPHMQETGAGSTMPDRFSIQPKSAGNIEAPELKPFQLKEDKGKTNTGLPDQRIVQRTIYNGNFRVNSELAAIANITSKLEKLNHKISEDKIKTVVKSYLTGAKKNEKITTEEIATMLIDALVPSGSTLDVRHKQKSPVNDAPTPNILEKEKKSEEIIENAEEVDSEELEEEDSTELQEFYDELPNDFDENAQNSNNDENEGKSEVKDSDDRPGQWGDYLEKNAIDDPVQRFGLEIELKLAKIAYDDKEEEGGFFKFAVSKGHIDIARSHIPGFEVHLDQLDKDTAIFEIVLKPGLPLDEFIPKLDYIKLNFLNKPVTRTWFDKFFVWSEHVKPDIQGYIYENMTGSTRIKGMPVQVTTTHTGEELRALTEAIKDNPEKYMASNRFKTHIKDLTSKKPKTKGEYLHPNADEFIINQYLGKASTLKERMYEGKGGSAMIKHAAEQFDSYRHVRGGGAIPETTPVVRIRKGNEILENLHAFSNKPAPVFKRNGQIAYVIEYRTESKIATAVNDYFLKKIDLQKLKTVLSMYVGKSKRKS